MKGEETMKIVVSVRRKDRDEFRARLEEDDSNELPLAFSGKREDMLDWVAEVSRLLVEEGKSFGVELSKSAREVLSSRERAA